MNEGDFDTILSLLTVYLSLSEIVDLKMKYDESDNVMVRASRAVTDRVSQLLGESVHTYVHPLG